MKTIEHKEKVYQVGGIYEFSDDGEEWCIDRLEDINQYVTYPYETCPGDGYNFIRACEFSLGTITEAPVELIDGECYQYTSQLGNERKWFFSAKHNTFCSNGGWSGRSECTNIKLLVVGEQQ